MNMPDFYFVSISRVQTDDHTSETVVTRVVFHRTEKKQPADFEVKATIKDGLVTIWHPDIQNHIGDHSLMINIKNQLQNYLMELI